MNLPPRSIPVEQAVYGSFAFRDEGYAVLARSPGCRDEWVDEFCAACRHWGERPAGAVDAPALFALRLPSGPWAVVRVSPQGNDDRGRPGALAFHGLLVAARDYRRAGADPFAFAPWHRDDWSADTRELRSERVAVAPAVGCDEPCRGFSLFGWLGSRLRDPGDSSCSGTTVPSAARRGVVFETPATPVVAEALARGRRVAVESPGPIDDLARQVWRALPRRVRGRASVATWAFGNRNQFDLLAVPRLAAVAFDASYLVIEPAGESVRAIPFPVRTPRTSVARGVALSLALLLAVAAVGVALRGAHAPETTTSPTVRPRRDATAPIPPPRPVAVADLVDPAERGRVAEALADLADRFGAVLGRNPDRPAVADPVLLMERIARDLRYRGPLLGASDLDADSSHDAALARRWDALVRRFAPDRPLPRDFRQRPLASQVAAFAWSFHFEAGHDSEPNGPLPAPSEVVQALGESLAVDGPVRPTPLSRRLPALADYLAFLGRLPRR